MTDPETGATSYAEALPRLQRATARVRRRQAALRDERREAARLAVEALRLGLAEGVRGVRVEVQSHSPFDAMTMRSIAAEAGIPPDERYARRGAAPTDPPRSGGPRLQPTRRRKK